MIIHLTRLYTYLNARTIEMFLDKKINKNNRFVCIMFDKRIKICTTAHSWTFYKYQKRAHDGEGGKAGACDEDVNSFLRGFFFFFFKIRVFDQNSRINDLS